MVLELLRAQLEWVRRSAAAMRGPGQSHGVSVPRIWWALSSDKDWDAGTAS